MLSDCDKNGTTASLSDKAHSSCLQIGAYHFGEVIGGIVSIPAGNAHVAAVQPASDRRSPDARDPSTLRQELEF